MAGRLLLPLDFASDADFILDFLILGDDGNPQDLTGWGASFACALANGTGGFLTSVGSGILTLGADGRVKVREVATAMNDRAGLYDPCELRLMPLNGATVAKAIITCRIATGASQIVDGAAPAWFGPYGVGPYTVIVDAAGNLTLSVGVPADEAGQLDFSDPDNSGLIGH